MRIWVDEPVSLRVMLDKEVLLTDADPETAQEPNEYPVSMVAFAVYEHVPEVEHNVTSTELWSLHSFTVPSVMVPWGHEKSTMFPIGQW